MTSVWGCGIRSLASFLAVVAAVPLLAAPHITFEAHGDEAWANILSSLGLQQGAEPSVETAIGRDAAYWMPVLQAP